MLLLCCVPVAVVSCCGCTWWLVIQAARLLTLSLNALYFAGDTSHETSDLIFERLVLSSVDKRIDATVGEHQNRGKVVEPDQENFIVMGKRIECKV